MEQLIVEWKNKLCVRHRGHAAPYLLIRGNFDISEEEIGALWKCVPTDDSDCADAFRAPVALSPLRTRAAPHSWEFCHVADQKAS